MGTWVNSRATAEYRGEMMGASPFKRNTTPERNKPQEGGSPKRFKLSPDMVKPNFGNDTDVLYARLSIYTRRMKKNCASLVLYI